MKIAVINTGGTISCVGTPLSPMTASQFAAACSKFINPTILQNYPDITLHYVVDLIFPESKSGTLDSTNLQPTDWCLLASHLLASYADFDGWVILHGTDSMDFTGAALPMLLSAFSSSGATAATLSKPIIITGSQMPMFYQAAPSAAEPHPQPSGLLNNTDAFQNFCGAVAAAQTGIPEVGVYFQNTLYRGNRVLKTNASEFNAFSSPNYPALAQYGVELEVKNNTILPQPVSYAVSLDNPLVLQEVNEQLASITANINGQPVMQFNAFPAWYSFPSDPASPGISPTAGYPTPTSDHAGILAKLIDACVGQGIKGLILQSYGEGNFPSGNPDSPSHGATYQALKRANDSGVVTVDCTQVICGVVNNNAYAAGAWLPAVGALSSADMTPMAAFAKLMVLLASAKYKHWSAVDVKRLMQLNLLGEMLDVSRLDSRGTCQLMPHQSLTALDGSARLVNDPVLGPRLLDKDGNLLWTAVQSPAAEQMPGRLVMQNDGKLVYYSRNNAALWATSAGEGSGASSMLVLGGSVVTNSIYGPLTLSVYDYANDRVSEVLYLQPLVEEEPPH